MNRLKIIKYPWHTGHDYELSKLPHDFLYLTNTPRRWANHYRPIPENIKWVPHLEAETSDLMILHLDQWAYDEPSKRFLFLRFRDSYQGPKIVIIHGGNMVDGCTSSQMRELVGDCYAVCNSETALEQWNLPHATFIRHGMSPEEWPSTDYYRNNIVMVLPSGPRHQATRNQAGIEKTLKRVEIDWIGKNIKPKGFDDYQNFLAKSSIFFNPSYASCNPRARTEAMLSGLAIVTTNSHREDQYIKNGINGFCSNNFNELIDYLEYLLANPAKAREIGLAGQETAREIFHIDNFIAQWNSTLKGFA